MNCKHQLRDLQVLSILGPWDTQPDENCISKYCSDLIQPTFTLKKSTNLPKINQKRAVSTCSTVKKTDVTSFPERTTYSRKNLYSLNQVSQKRFQTVSQHRADKLQKKKMEKENVLQELSVKNFIIEGGQDPCNYNQKKLKKRENSFVMKHKFAEFRRSLKTVIQNKQNSNFRVLRYDN